MEPHPDDVGIQLFRLCRGLHRLAHREFEQIGLHRGQPPALVALRHHDGMTHGDLAAALDVTPATISKMVKNLEQAGFVVRRRDEADERVSRVYLTDAGRAVISVIETAMGRIEREALSGFDGAEQRQVRTMLVRIAGNLHRAADGCCREDGRRHDGASHHGHDGARKPRRSSGLGDGQPGERDQVEEVTR